MHKYNGKRRGVTTMMVYNVEVNMDKIDELQNKFGTKVLFIGRMKILTFLEIFELFRDVKNAEVRANQYSFSLKGIDIDYITYRETNISSAFDVHFWQGDEIKAVKGQINLYSIKWFVDKIYEIYGKDLRRRAFYDNTYMDVFLIEAPNRVNRNKYPFLMVLVLKVPDGYTVKWIYPSSRFIPILSPLYFNDIELKIPEVGAKVRINTDVLKRIYMVLDKLKADIFSISLYRRGIRLNIVDSTLKIEQQIYISGEEVHIDRRAGKKENMEGIYSFEYLKSVLPKKTAGNVIDITLEFGYRVPMQLHYLSINGYSVDGAIAPRASV